MSDKKRIMLIDNEEGLCRMMEAVLADSGYAVKGYTRSFEAVEEFKAGDWDLVVSDIKMPGMDGLEVLQRIKAKDPLVPVIMITAYATVETSIQALRRGAYDMVTKPFEPEELLYRVKNALKHTQLLEENRELREELVGKFRFDNIIGASTGLKDVLDKVEKIAIRDTSVLITGESGTGKELIAQAIHYNSLRKEKKFVAINCGALPESLLESELFGYRKGAFTGAKENRQGLLEAADGGTLFLDEAGNLPMNVQKTLLRFLQEQEFLRIGDTTPTKVDVRIISATNAELKEAVKSGAFREDLYYRLNVLNLHLPPLRERRADIPLLAAHFITLQNKKFGTAIKGLAPDALEAVMEFSWPGNIRQLKNVIEACTAMENGDYLSLAVLSQFIEISHHVPGEEGDTAGDVDESDYSQALSRFEVDYLKGLLRKNRGNVEAAARDAGMNMATIYRKLKKYNIRREDYA
ncbi:sigma-54 dependent transcriptional regulator [Geobacter sulfurreducens]|uniref:Sigma-54-dependent transcriptional response regulator n=1 Tax=Geobacter sulfurreducens (strain ATCC 51573 / DSM 12127 / PCA) TaxID=243231 RepID=Q74EJ9_GEOSL|nr:sigma-54 dependent transcriptional regulator [Geobacter sulfurreducens]AAR34290.2 sigma-54-dependent transcriptional response regulator [Geobacter sulfurreducens PCA]AJY70698.1 Fis family transcriptional regulator [Geobacter sulfurreducens]UAC05019.1 sigma-54 dependent transcriptional regulator [Geobacter sulfurreducens]HCD95735.1 sigma-54-dependent Fis family transcriptional regulator [Geobacter sulfurreducens]